MPAPAPKIVELPPDTPMATAPRSSSISSRKAPTTKKAGLTKGNDRNKVAAAATTTTTSWPFFLFKWTLVSVLVAFGAAQFIAGDLLWGYRGKYVKKQTYFPPNHRVFTPEELWQYNGQDPDKPVYLSILGKVYDVTTGRWVYGPRGSYHFFAGRDASRAYVTGCFETHLTHDVRGLTLEELQQIAMWKTFFDEHPRYVQIGTLDLPTIDPNSPIPEPCNDNAASKDPSDVAT